MDTVRSLGVDLKEDKTCSCTDRIDVDAATFPKVVRSVM
jgi:hypothetical protein